VRMNACSLELLDTTAAHSDRRATIAQPRTASQRDGLAAAVAAFPLTSSHRQQHVDQPGARFEWLQRLAEYRARPVELDAADPSLVLRQLDGYFTVAGTGRTTPAGTRDARRTHAMIAAASASTALP